MTTGTKPKGNLELADEAVGFAVLVTCRTATPAFPRQDDPRGDAPRPHSPATRRNNLP